MYALNIVHLKTMRTRRGKLPDRWSRGKDGATAVSRARFKTVVFLEQGQQTQTGAARKRRSSAPQLPYTRHGTAEKRQYRRVCAHSFLIMGFTCGETSKLVETVYGLPAS